jgi:hypothetical protein
LSFPDVSQAGKVAAAAMEMPAAEVLRRKERRFIKLKNQM